MMNHSHQILEITDLRNEASRNSSSLGFQDIWSPGSPPGPWLAPAPLALQPSTVAVGHGSPQSSVPHAQHILWPHGFKLQLY